MHLLTTFLVAVGLGADAFSVALGIGAAAEHKRRQELRLAASFGLFQGVMPLIGWLLGAHVLSRIAAYDHWIAFGILTVIGAKMIVEACLPEHQRPQVDRTRGWQLFSLSVATSLDALGAGMALGIKELAIAVPCVIIAVVAFLMTFIGYHFGRRFSALVGREAEVVGGLILIGIGVRLLFV